MVSAAARRGSMFVYHVHMGGPDADALEWRALKSSRFAPRVRQMGVQYATRASEADVVVLTGVLTARNLDAVLAQVAQMPSPSVLVAAGDAATDGGAWAKAHMPGLEHYPLSHYVDVQVAVPGEPPTPQALIAALAAAAEILMRPGERASGWQDE